MKRLCVSILAMTLAGGLLGATEPQRTANPPRPVALAPLPQLGGSEPLCDPTVVPHPFPTTLAVAVLDGPPNRGTLVQQLRNVSTEPIRFAFLDAFGSHADEGLCLDAVEPLIPPAGGRMDAVYPQAGTCGVGPVLMGFQGFLQEGCAAYLVNASSWTGPHDIVGVQDLLGARIEVVFEGGIRGAGTFRDCTPTTVLEADAMEGLCVPGQAIAFVAQTYPPREH